MTAIAIPDDLVSLGHVFERRNGGTLLARIECISKASYKTKKLRSAGAVLPAPQNLRVFVPLTSTPVWWGAREPAAISRRPLANSTRKSMRFAICLPT
jgi:hypothetical protein